MNDIDGHVQNLRIGLSEEDLKYRKKPDKRSDTTKAGRDIQHIPERIGKEDNNYFGNEDELDIGTPIIPQPWRDTVLPDDFALFNFTPLEEETRTMTVIDDRRLGERGVQHLLTLCVMPCPLYYRMK